MTVEHNNNQTVSQPEQTVGTTLMVPIDTWKRLRNLATERRVSAQSLWLRAIEELLSRERSAA